MQAWRQGGIILRPPWHQGDARLARDVGKSGETPWLHRSRILLIFFLFRTGGYKLALKEDPKEVFKMVELNDNHAVMVENKLFTEPFVP